MYISQLFMCYRGETVLDLYNQVIRWIIPCPIFKFVYKTFHFFEGSFSNGSLSLLPKKETLNGVITAC
jgi:hypothetical protein